MIFKSTIIHLRFFSPVVDGVGWIPCRCARHLLRSGKSGGHIESHFCRALAAAPSPAPRPGAPARHPHAAQVPPWTRAPGVPGGLPAMEGKRHGGAATLQRDAVAAGGRVYGRLRQPPAGVLAGRGVADGSAALGLPPGSPVLAGGQRCGCRGRVERKCGRLPTAVRVS